MMLNFRDGLSRHQYLQIYIASFWPKIKNPACNSLLGIYNEDFGQFCGLEGRMKRVTRATILGIKMAWERDLFTEKLVYLDLEFCLFFGSRG